MAFERRGSIVVSMRTEGAQNIDKAADGFKRMDFSVSGAITSMGKAIIGSNLLMGAVRELTGGLAGAARTALEWNDRIGNNSAEIEKYSRAVGGLIAPLDLAKLKQQLTTDGFKATQTELESAGKAVVQYARVNEVDMATAQKKVTDAIRNGSTKALREMGMEVTATGSKSQKSAAVMGALVSKFKDVKISAENANEQLAKIGNSAQAAIGKLGQAVIDSGPFQWAMKQIAFFAEWASEKITLLTGSIDSLNKSQTIQRLISARDDLRELIEDSSGGADDRADIEKKIKEVAALESRVNKLNADALKVKKRGPAPEAPGISGSGKPEEEKEKPEKTRAAVPRRIRDEGGVSPAIDAMAEEVAHAKVLSLDEFRARMDGSFAIVSQSLSETMDEMPSIADRVNQYAADVENRTDIALEAGAQLGQLQQKHDEIAALVAELEERAGPEGDFSGFTDDEAAQASLEGSLAKAQAYGRERDALGKLSDAFAEHQDLQMEISDGLSGSVIPAIEGMGQALVGGAVAAIKSTGSIGKAMQAFLGMILKQISQWAAARALLEIGLGVATLFTAPQEAATHFLSAGLLAAVAVGTGVAGASLGSAGASARSAGGGSSRPAYSTSSAPPPPPEPTREREKQIGVAVYLGNTTDPSAATHSRKQIQAEAKEAA